MNDESRSISFTEWSERPSVTPVWVATRALRRAESLAGFAGEVSGPADSPPAAMSTDWMLDWIERAKRTLEKALDEAKRDADDSKDRARQMAEAIKTGAEQLRTYTNPAYAAGQAAGDAVKQRAQAMYEGAQGDARSTIRSRLDRIIEFAKKIILYSALGVGTLVVLWLAFSILLGWGATKTFAQAKGAAREYAH